MRETLTKDGKLGLRLLEDLTALAAGGSVCAGLELVHCSKLDLFVWLYDYRLLKTIFIVLIVPYVVQILMQLSVKVTLFQHNF